MSGVLTILRASVLVLAPLFICACHKINPAPPENPAPLQPAGHEIVYDFDKDAAGKIAAWFHNALTGSGAKADWVVKTDSTAPTQPNVLAQMSDDNTGYRFPLAIVDEGSFRDLEVSVRFKPVSGSGDQAAGLVWRLKDANNYYIVRANALEDNVVLYKVENGQRVSLSPKGAVSNAYGVKHRVPKHTWTRFTVAFHGSLFTVSLDGEKLFEVEDSTFAGTGKTGLWTKADSVIYFDDFEIIPDKDQK